MILVRQHFLHLPATFDLHQCAFCASSGEFCTLRRSPSSLFVVCNFIIFPRQKKSSGHPRVPSSCWPAIQVKSSVIILKMLGKTTDRTLGSLFEPNFIMHTDKEIIMNRRRVIGSDKQEEKPTIKVQTTRQKREEVMDCSCNLIHH